MTDPRSIGNRADNARNSQPDIISKITSTLTEFAMIRHNDKVIAAVSGGPDSVALLRILVHLEKELCISLCVAHFNHRLRNEESLRDEIFVRQLSESLNLPFYSSGTDVKEYAAEHRLSIEEAGRQVRYAFFDAISRDHGFTKIATGHTFDDNGELVLMNLLRGSGPKGLAGIPPVRDKKYIRPLIRVSKKELLSYLKSINQNYMTDSSNIDPAYLRNRVRNSLIPQLADEYNPEILEGLNRVSRIFRQEEDFMDHQTEKALETCLSEQNRNQIILSKNKMAQLHPALISRVFRKAVQILKKDLKRISFTHMDSIIDFCFHQKGGKSMDLPGKIRVYKTKDSFKIKKENQPLRDLGKKEKAARLQAKQSRENI